MELDWLRDFIALVENLNFSRASSARNITQPAFSRRIRALEAWLGTPLFMRSTHEVSLTPAGRRFLPLATDLLGRLERARREVGAAAGQEASALSLVATRALSFTFFPAWIRAHLGFGQLGALNLVSESLEACERLMLAGQAQLMLCHDHPAAPVRLPASRFESIRVGTDRLALLGAPHGTGQGRLLGYGAASGLGRILAACRAGDAAEEPVYTAHLAATLMQMAREGQGLAWLPLTLAGEELAAGHLVRGAPEAEDIPLEIRLFRPRGRQSPAVTALWDSASR